MTALAKNRTPGEARWNTKLFTLLSGTIAFEGGAAFLNPATGKVSPATAAGAAYVFIGTFAEKVDASAADKPVNVQLPEEITLTYFVNGSSIAAADVGKLCYFDDDQTVVLTAGARALAGRVLDVSATKGVGVDLSLAKLSKVPLAGPTAAFTANDYAPTDIVNGAVYNVPTTAAASTVTLPAAAADGTVAYFSADGTLNGHTVQYRDATGPVVLTTALLASKRHLVSVAKVNGKWTANAYVSP